MMHLLDPMSLIIFLSQNLYISVFLNAVHLLHFRPPISSFVSTLLIHKDTQQYFCRKIAILPDYWQTQHQITVSNSHVRHSWLLIRRLKNKSCCGIHSFRNLNIFKSSLFTSKIRHNLKKNCKNVFTKYLYFNMYASADGTVNKTLLSYANTRGKLNMLGSVCQEKKKCAHFMFVQAVVPPKRVQVSGKFSSVPHLHLFTHNKRLQVWKKTQLLL